MSPYAPRYPEAGAYRTAAELRAALLRLADALPPADAIGAQLPEWRPAEDGEAADYVEIRTSWQARAGCTPTDLQANARPMVAMQGPAIPRGACPPVWFAFTPEPGVRSSFKLQRDPARLRAMAEEVRKHWARYGGGPKPADLAPKPRAPRRRDEIPVGQLRAWADMHAEAMHADALACGDTLGARFYPAGERGRFVILAGLQPVEGLPPGIVSAYRAHDRRFIVMHDASGLTIGNQSGATRKAAEDIARAAVADVIERSGPDALARAIERATPADCEAARAAWCAAVGLTVPDAPAQDPAPAEAPAAPADLVPARAAELGAPAAPAPAAAPAGPPAPAAPAAPPSPPVAEITEPAAAPIAWQVSAARPTAIYCTPAVRIGVHEWCTVVYVHEIYGACTDHVWRRTDTARAGGPHEGGRFRNSRGWPAYDSNDTYSGLPRSIGPRIFDVHRAAIDAALERIRAGQLPDWAPQCARDALAMATEYARRRADSLAQLAAARAPAPPAAPDPAPAPAETTALRVTGIMEPAPVREAAERVAELEAPADDAAPAGFRAMLLGFARQKLERMRQAFDTWDPAAEWLELSSPSAPGKYRAVLRDASAPGRWRWSGFDAAGFSGHESHASAEDAIADCVAAGFYVPAPGMLDSLASAPTWARGMAVCEVMQDHARGAIDWRTACDRMRAITETEPPPAETGATISPSPASQITETPHHGRQALQMAGALARRPGGAARRARFGHRMGLHRPGAGHGAGPRRAGAAAGEARAAQHPAHVAPHGARSGRDLGRRGDRWCHAVLSSAPMPAARAGPARRARAGGRTGAHPPPTG